MIGEITWDQANFLWNSNRFTWEDVKLILAAGEEGFLGPFEVDAFNSAAGTLEIDYTAVTSVTIAALYI